MKNLKKGGIILVNIHSNGNRIAYGIKHFNLDIFSDLKKLNKDILTPGSTVFIIDTSRYYMLNGAHKWIEINPYGMGSSEPGDGDGSGDGSTPDDENIYDGGSIDGSDPR